MRSSLSGFLLLFAAFFLTPVSAALVVTKFDQIRGRIVRLEENRVILQADSGSEMNLSKEIILTIHDDEGKLLWSNPSIVLEDTTPDKPAAPGRFIIAKERPKWEIEASGGIGLMSVSTWFSTFPLGVRHDYRHLLEFNATGVRNLEGGGAFTASLGYSQRNLTASGITTDNVYGVAVWPMRFIDLRLGYRIREDWLFVEAGLLQTIQIGNSPLSIDSGSKTTELSDARADTGGYLAFYLSLGAIIPVYRNLSGLLALRYDHGITSAVDASVATQTGASGEVVSSAPLRLIPWSVTLHLGVNYRL